MRARGTGVTVGLPLGGASLVVGSAGYRLNQPLALDVVATVTALVIFIVGTIAAVYALWR